MERGNSKLLMICIHWFSKILFAILRKERDRECFWCLGGSFLFAPMNALHNCNALYVCYDCMYCVHENGIETSWAEWAFADPVFAGAS